MSQHYHVPLFLFQQSNSAGYTNLENQIEEAILAEHQQLKEEDISAVEEFFKTFKTEGFRERRRYGQLCSRFRDNLRLMNGFQARDQLIQEYVRALESEFMNEYDP